MDRKLPVYKLVVSEELDNSGVFAIALVDKPAIKTNWFLFDEQIKFAIQEDRQIVTMPIMIADLPIYRRDKERGEFYVLFEASEIEKIQQKFMMNNHLHNVNEMHDSNNKVEGVYLVNSFVSDEEMGIKAPEMFKDLPNGTWYGSYKFTDKKYWDEMVKTGNFQAVSVEGIFDMVDEKKQLEKQILDEVKNILS